MGEDELVATERPFQSMKAVERTSAKFRIWVRSCRGEALPRAESMVLAVEGVVRSGWCGLEGLRRPQSSVGRTDACWKLVSCFQLL